MERKENINRPIIIFIYVVYAVGLAGHLINPLKPLIINTTPFALLATGSSVLYLLYREAGKRLLLTCITVYLITFLVEVAAVKTGFIFGHYVYGSTLGVKFLGVPLLIGFNWLLIIFCSVSISITLSENIYTASLISAVLAVLIDFFLEPVAAALNYWHWQNSIVPLQNYIAWFLITFALSYFIIKAKVKLSVMIPANYYIAQLLFFTGLYSFYIK